MSEGRQDGHHFAKCRQCGFILGRMAPRSTKPDYTPGVHVTVNLPEQRIELVCPRCGQRRSFTDVVFHAMTIPEVAS